MIEAGVILQNRYRIEKHIGQGGMGKVYVATDERFKSTVAIKETFFEDEHLRKAFEREARLLNSLKHSALPRVSDHFNENEGQFLVMEYIAGEDLAEKMERSGHAFSLRDVLKWAGQLCDALEYLHSQEIIHRDIKPQNLKVTPNGQIILLDFGLAKGNPTDAPHQTAAKSIFGYSRSYASLEQIQGAGTEPRSDLYSLSATLYHLLTGIPPADALTRAMNVLNNQPDPLIAVNLINKTVPDEIARILKTTMALNAAERPESAASLRSLLEESSKGIDYDRLDLIDQNPFDPQLLTQKTKILSPATEIPNKNQSQINTKVLSADETKKDAYQTRLDDINEQSQLTNIRKPIVPVKSRKNRRIIGAGIFGGLLLAGGSMAMFSLYDFEDSKVEANIGNANVEMQKSFVDNSQNDNQSNSNISVNTVNPENKETESKAQPGVVKSKSSESTKKSKSQTSTSQRASKTNKSNNDKDYMIINEDSIETGNMIIDDNGIRLKNQHPQLPNAPNKPALPPSLSTEQIRALEKLKNIKNRVIILKTPTPKP